MKPMQVFAGIDMHSSTSTATLQDDKGTPLRVMTVKTSKEGIRSIFAGLNNKKIKAVFEASRNWPYYARLLGPYCNELIMAHPLKVRAIASAKIKTDTIDSRTLANLLRANLIPESYMPSLSIVELRELLRYRAKMSRLRATLKIKVRDILSREGKSCEFSDVTTKQARLWLNDLDLSELNRRELDYLISLIDNMCEEIKKLDKTIDREQYRHPETEILKSIVGINTFSALLILAEIGDFTRFETANKLAAYAGVVPSTYQSSKSCYHGNITRQGSKWLRWILCQCTHACIKSRKSHKLKRFYLRLAKKRGKQKAIVATSRKMLTIIWHLLNKNEYYAY